jgi:hypothetical protein
MAGRSYTDPHTNETVFFSAELFKRLPELIDRSTPPPASLLPTFLHEATHHWCFTSSLGTTIALLAMRGRWNMMRATEAKTDEEASRLEKQAADDLIRAEYANVLLRPLAEGLATFGEFDLTIGNRSPVVPPPLRWAAMFCARDTAVGDARNQATQRLAIAQSLNSALLETRVSERVQRAKETLLVEPLSCVLSDGYLAGYLAVKALWRHFRRLHPGFNTPDVFLLGAYQIFFEDFVLIKLLLDQSQSLPSALDPLAPHLFKRFEAALQISRKELNAFFDSLSAKRSQLFNDPTAPGRVLPMADPWDEKPSKRFLGLWEVVMGTSIDKLPKWTPSLPVSEQMLVSGRMILYGRDLLGLGSVPARLNIGQEDTTVEVTGQRAVRLRTLKSVPAGESDGRIHIFLNLRNGEHVVAAVLPSRQLVALRRTSELERSDDVATERAALGQVSATYVHDAIVGDVLGKLGGDKLREISRMGGYLAQAKERLDMVYGMPALIFVPEDRLEVLLRKMNPEGLYGAFDHDSDLVRALALIGSMAHVHWEPNALKAKFAEAGLDFDTVMGRLRTFATYTNLFELNEEFGVQSSL